MKNTFFKKGILIAFTALSALFLSSCSEEPKESPEEVIQKFKSAMTQVESGDLALDFSIRGSDAQDNLDFKSELGLKFDRQKESVRKADLKVELSGAMAAAGRSLSGDLAFQVRGIDNDFYLKLDQLDSDDKNLELFKPILQAYTGRWLKLNSDALIPENLRKLQQKDEATLEKEQKRNDLFIKSSLFNVNKDYGVEKVNGVKAYHYGIELQEEALTHYLRNAAALEGRELTEKDLQNVVYLTNSMTSAELWIGADDYYLYKAVLVLNTPPTESNKVNLRVEIIFEANAYNKGVDIETPSDAEEFDPAALLGLPQTPAAVSPVPEFETGANPEP